MTSLERETQVCLDAMSEEQLEIVRDTVIDKLVGKTSDLHLLYKEPDPKRVIREVAALGRLAFWLQHDEVVVPDRMARRVMTHLVEDFDEVDEELRRRYEEALARHDPVRVFAAYLLVDAGSEGR